MSSSHLGTRYDTVPIPPLPENTTWYDAGAVRLGIEYRHLTDDIVDAAFAARPDEAAVVDAARPALLDDEGWSLHVVDGATDEEWLRFDMFDDGPHYHYIVPGQYNLSIDIDTNALGEPIPWALGAVRDRVATMLRYAGNEDLAAKVDPDAVAAAIDQVDAHVRAGIPDTVATA
ncbi:MAG TPA: hypothetical protein VFU19_04380 [Iamia sp.]|nr:hypothetical protein [Iamia sp.]